MKRKFLYALGLLLCLSTVALSNNCSRFWCGVSGKATTHCRAAVHGSAAEKAAAAEQTASRENHMFLHTFIKLLYI